MLLICISYVFFDCKHPNIKYNINMQTRVIPEHILENICDIIGETSTGLTGTKISKYLKASNIEEYTPQGVMLAKRKILYHSLSEKQKNDKCSNNVLTFISTVMSPANFVNNISLFEEWKININKQLAFVGYELQDDSSYKEIQKASTILDVKIKTENLKKELESRKAHPQIFNYCKEELLQNNYFHSVLEANKGLFKRIRELSTLEKDGQNLIEQVFSDSNPIVIINNYQSQSEKNEHRGFRSLLIGLCAMFRNTTAHELKVDWPIQEQDALEILGIISYCHGRLDQAQRIRNV